MTEIKRVFTAVDNPDKRDYSFERFSEEYAQSWATLNKKRPYNSTVFDQGSTPMCTWYGLTHVYNWENINEYANNGLVFTELNPNTFTDNHLHYLATRLAEFKLSWKIEGWTSITNSEKDKATKMKKAIDMGMFIYTGSAYWDWWAITRTKVYSENKNKEFVWHAYCIVDYDDSKWMFVAKNSWWDDWGNKWYFYIKYEDVYKLYTAYVIIDKDDTGTFKKFKLKEKIRQFVALGKDIYNDENCDTFTKNKFNSRQIGKTFTTYYGL